METTTIGNKTGPPLARCRDVLSEQVTHAKSYTTQGNATKHKRHTVAYSDNFSRCDGILPYTA